MCVVYLVIEVEGESGEEELTAQHIRPPRHGTSSLGPRRQQLYHRERETRGGKKGGKKDVKAGTRERTETKRMAGPF